DHGQLSSGMVAALRADATFEVQETSEAQAIGLVREGKARAAVVIPAGFGDASWQALLQPAAKKPEIAIHFDPSQAMTLALVRGLLVQHAFASIGRAASGVSMTMPFEMRQAEVVGGLDRRYNGYAHSFAGMGVQFILF